MKQETKHRMMEEKIVSSAIKEFNTHEFKAASLNRICENGHISKGIIYHYFKDKDDLYLTCVRRCFEELNAYCQSADLQYKTPKEGITQYLRIRMAFFQKYPEYKNLFFHATLRTPSHLKAAVQQLKEPLDKGSLLFFRKLLSGTSLKDFVSLDGAIEFLDLQITVFNRYIQNRTENCKDLQSVIAIYEEKIEQWLDMILYGLLKEYC